MAGIPLGELITQQGGWLVLAAIMIIGFKWTRSDIDRLSGEIEGKAEKKDLRRIERQLSEINGRVREHSSVISRWRGQKEVGRE